MRCWPWVRQRLMMRRKSPSAPTLTLAVPQGSEACLLSRLTARCHHCPRRPGARSAGGDRLEHHGRPGLRTIGRRHLTLRETPEAVTFQADGIAGAVIQPGRVRRFVGRELPGVLGGQIPELLRQGAQTYGFRGDMLTRERGAEMVRRAFGVAYTAQHIGCLLREYRPKRRCSRPLIDARDAAAPESHTGAIYRRVLQHLPHE